MVLFEIFEQIVSSQHLCYFNQLIPVALPHKERFFFEQLHNILYTIEANMAPVDQISKE